jgi:hypothetical protein
MSGRSSIDSLRRLSPVSDGDAAAVFGTAGQEELLADLTRLPFGRGAQRRPVTHRRRRLALAVAVVALTAIATAATWVVLRGAPARDTTSVQCLIGDSDAIIPATSGDPAHDCVVDYRREFGTAPPRLTAYDNGHGGVTVIPRSEKPQAGWTRLVSGQNVDLIQLQDSLDDYVNGLDSTCLGARAATRLAAAKLAQFGFTGWKVDVRKSGSAPGRSCVDLNLVDPGSQTVTLMPTGIPSGLPATTFEKLAARLRPVTRKCTSLPAALASVRAVARHLGLQENARGYDLNATTDNSMPCASIYETVGGTIFLTVRGPSG